jgi:hypothetical protein
MRLLLVLLVIVSSSFAFAENGDRQPLGDGYTLLVDNWGIYVLKGKQRAKIAPGFAILDAKVDKKAKKVAVEIDNNDCAGTNKYTWTFGHLDARIENAAAYALHKKKDYKGSSAGFAKAVAADPTWNIAAYNLASALQLLGDKAGATKALVPWIASAPMQTYLQVTFDAELAPLLDQPELKALRVAKPGNAKVDGTGTLVGTVAYSKEKNLVAVTRSEASWGACSHTEELELRDAKTGALVAHVPSVQWSETEVECSESGGELVKSKRPVVAARGKAFTQMLRDLGFSTTKLEKGEKGRSETSNATTISFKKAKLGIAGNNHTARLLAKDQVLGQTTILENLESAVLVEEPRIAVLWSLRPGAEGCEGTDPTDVSIISYTK